MSGAVAGVGNFVHNIGQLFSPPKAPELQAPTALSKQPTQAEAATAAINKTLDQEKVAASTSTVLTGGQGLLDQPTTTSRTLLGS
jgi:hypothetical protein